jgi:tRNA nucleotidyltransferase (CCA-adding enzyme)
METPSHDILAQAEQLASVADLLAVLGVDFEPSVWLVGGAVRDLLLGREPADVDLMVDGEFDAVAAALGGPLLLHDAYLTASVGGYDLARPRTETYARPGALPDVVPAGTVDEDLVRRDFSANAVAVGLTGAARGELRAVDAALADITARRLAVLHPQSFLDDPTRLLRLARYAARLDFSVAEETLALAHDAIGAGAIATVSGTRIGNELRKLATEADPVRAFGALRELGIDAAIDPVLGLIDEPLARRALVLLEPSDRRDRVVLAAALMGATRAQVAEVLGRWGFTAEDRDVIADAAVNAGRVSARLEFAGPRSAIDWAAGGPDGIAETVALAGAIHPANAAREWLVELRHMRLSIDGRDLLAAGVAPGPAIGAGLAAARAALMDDLADDAESQLEAALDAARSV